MQLQPLHRTARNGEIVKAVALGMIEVERIVVTAIIPAWTDAIGAITPPIAIACHIASGSRIRPVTDTIITVTMTVTAIDLVSNL